MISDWKHNHDFRLIFDWEHSQLNLTGSTVMMKGLGQGSRIQPHPQPQSAHPLMSTWLVLSTSMCTHLLYDLGGCQVGVTRAVGFDVELGLGIEDEAPQIHGQVDTRVSVRHDLRAQRLLI